MVWSSTLLALLVSDALGHQPSQADALIRSRKQDIQAGHIADRDHRELPPSWKNECKIDGERIGIYIGGGTGTSSKKWAQALATFWLSGNRAPDDSTRLNTGGGATYSGDASATYVTFTDREFDNCYNDELSTLDLLVMPGGSAYLIQDKLGSEGKAAITRYLDQGGNYIGFCAGGYYLSRGYYWKGNDGSPTDNCDNKFCKYEIDGTFSYDESTQDFTRHEWNGQSYHSNLLGYGPLANVLVEGPIEEIAGPWDPPGYDSVVVESNDPLVPTMRQIYYGGATEGYIYTDGSNWGTELAHFITDNGDGDLDYPNGSLWTLKETVTGHGGKIMISSAHIEASLFSTSIGDGGMTECQQYNNYVFVTKALSDGVLNLATLPEYDMACSSERKSVGERIDTDYLYSGGLAYATAPRIGGRTTTTTTRATTTTSTTTTGGSTGVTTTGGTGSSTTSISSTTITTTSTTDSLGAGGACGDDLEVLAFYDFEDGSYGGGTRSGTALRPWAIHRMSACNGSEKGISAGIDGDRAGGVDSETYFTVTSPPRTTVMSYFFSMSRTLDSGDDFHVIVNGNRVASYELRGDTDCASVCLNVPENVDVTFYCKSGGNNELCHIDQIRFQG